MTELKIKISRRFPDRNKPKLIDQCFILEYKNISSSCVIIKIEIRIVYIHSLKQYLLTLIEKYSDRSIAVKKNSYYSNTVTLFREIDSICDDIDFKRFYISTLWSCSKSEFYELKESILRRKT